ncbi:MAG: transcription factor S [Candidatus Pacearchaeota archaeon]|nr:transcription factor S [Candidatus Pacearchaeota archaeon]
MEFCPKCGTILVQKTKYFSCPKCKYVSKETIKLISSEKIESTEKIEVLKDEETSVWPKIKETCPKCGNDEAFFHSAQMRSGDEAETSFFRCTKCKHVWREYT